MRTNIFFSIFSWLLFLVRCSHRCWSVSYFRLRYGFETQNICTDGGVAEIQILRSSRSRSEPRGFDKSWITQETHVKLLIFLTVIGNMRTTFPISLTDKHFGRWRPITNDILWERIEISHRKCGCLHSETIFPATLIPLVKSGTVCAKNELNNKKFKCRENIMMCSMCASCKCSEVANMLEKLHQRMKNMCARLATCYTMQATSTATTARICKTTENIFRLF